MNILPYIKFNDDKCREGMEFYKSIFGGEIKMQTVGESPMAKEMGPEMANKIMHSTLTSENFTLMGMDMMRDKAVIGDNVGITVNYDKGQDEVAKKAFSMLSQGGEVFMEMEVAFWGDLFGVVTDKYGVEWMISCESQAKLVQ